MAVDKFAQGSGQWNEISWDPAGAPVSTDNVYIDGGHTVTYSEGTSPPLTRLYVGDNLGVGSSSGTLNIAGDELRVVGSAAGAIVAGLSDQSEGTINVDGGTLNGTGTATGIQLGVGANSTGHLNLKSGVISLGGGISVGLGSNGTGKMTVSGGTLTTSKSHASHFYVGGRRANATTHGEFEQTDGQIIVDHAEAYFAVGNAGHPTNTVEAQARIVGGSLLGNVKIGRESALISGGGRGVLSIGPAAEVSGRNAAWEISGNGELIFVLGATGKFPPVDLTACTAENALIFPQNDARITVNGTALPPSALPKPIVLIRFADGKGPSEESKKNVNFAYTGFDARYKPELVWTGTGLELKLK